MNTDLTKISFFRGLTAEEIEQFIKMTQAKIKSYDKGTRVIEAFVPNLNIGVLIRGNAQIVSLDRFGNEFIGHNLNYGSIFGVTSAVLGETAAADSIELTTDAVVLWIPYKSLLISALTVSASVKGGLFSVLLFPIILPVFFPAIKLTEFALQTSETNLEFLILMIFYDAVLLLVSSILYDYID